MTSPMSKSYVTGPNLATSPPLCASPSRSTWLTGKPPLPKEISLTVIVVVDTGLFVQTLLGRLLMNAVRDSANNINSARLGIHSAFVARSIHKS
jgi:hypothetical protein